LTRCYDRFSLLLRRPVELKLYAGGDVEKTRTLSAKRVKQPAIGSALLGAAARLPACRET